MDKTSENKKKKKKTQKRINENSKLESTNILSHQSEISTSNTTLLSTLKPKTSSRKKELILPFSRTLEFRNPPSFIVERRYKFLIFDAPYEQNLQLYLDTCVRNNVASVVRLCNSTYNSDAFTKNGITFYDLPFNDDRIPEKRYIVDEWLRIVKKTKKLLQCTVFLD